MVIAWIMLPGGITITQLLSAVIVCSVTCWLVLLGHGYLKMGDKFHIATWAKERVNVFAVGAVIILSLALIRGFTKDVAPLLSYFGIEAGKPGAIVMLGFAIAGFLLGMGPKLVKKNEEEKLSDQDKKSTPSP